MKKSEKLEKSPLTQEEIEQVKEAMREAAREVIDDELMPMLRTAVERLATFFTGQAPRATGYAFELVRYLSKQRLDEQRKAVALERKRETEQAVRQREIDTESAARRQRALDEHRNSTKPRVIDG